MKKSIEAAVNILFKIVESLCKIVLVFLICTVTAQVVMRMFGKNIKWCEEVMLLLLDALMFLLMSVGIKEGAVSKWLKQAMRGSAFFRNIFGQAKTECRKNGTQGIYFHKEFQVE